LESQMFERRQEVHDLNHASREEIEQLHQTIIVLRQEIERTTGVETERDNER